MSLWRYPSGISLFERQMETEAGCFAITRYHHDENMKILPTFGKHAEGATFLLETQLAKLGTKAFLVDTVLANAFCAEGTGEMLFYFKFPYHIKALFSWYGTCLI